MCSFVVLLQLVRTNPGKKNNPFIRSPAIIKSTNLLQILFFFFFLKYKKNNSFWVEVVYGFYGFTFQANSYFHPDNNKG